MQSCYRLCFPFNKHLFRNINSNDYLFVPNRYHSFLGRVKPTFLNIKDETCQLKQKNNERLSIVPKKLPSVDLSTKTPKTVKNNSANDSDVYREIFRFAHIPILLIVCRGKIYITTSLFACSPIILYSWWYDILGQQDLNTFSSLMGFSVGTLFLFGEFFRRCVCLVYISKDDTTVKLSHMSFWGKRKNIEVPLDDIVPLSETSERVGNIFWKISFYPNSDASKIVDRSNLIISTKFGNVKDNEAMIKIFGSEILSNDK